MGVHRLRGLEYLVAVVDHGGFNAAARQLGVATPSIHRMVSALEAELGVMLLDRSIRPVKPTAGAAGYVERARGLLAELRELDASLLDQAQAPRGTLVLAAQNVVLQFVLPELLPLFHAKYPEIRLDVVEAGNSRDLSRLGADMLIQFGWPPIQDAVLRTLAETRWLIVATPSYWARHGVPRHPSELKDHACALFRTPYGEVLREWHFERGAERVAVTVDGWVTSESRLVLDAALHGGQIVERINDLTARPSLLDGQLQAVLLDWEGMSSPPLSLIIKRSIVRQPRVRAWMDFVADYAQRLAASRLPAGLPQVRAATRPSWWRRRVTGGGRQV